MSYCDANTYLPIKLPLLHTTVLPVAALQTNLTTTGCGVDILRAGYVDIRVHVDCLRNFLALICNV
jgi:hypothetical protein